MGTTVAKSLTGSSVHKSKGTELEKQVEGELLETEVFDGFGMVAYELSRTINLGNYESVKIGVSFSLPCGVGQESNVYKDVKKFVTEKVEEEEDKWK